MMRTVIYTEAQWQTLIARFLPPKPPGKTKKVKTAAGNTTKGGAN